MAAQSKKKRGTCIYINLSGAKWNGDVIYASDRRLDQNTSTPTHPKRARWQPRLDGGSIQEKERNVHIYIYVDRWMDG